MIIPRFDELVTMGQLKKWQDMLEKERKAHHLTYLFWETTRACNLRCRHCGSDCSVARQDELTTAEIKGALKSIAEDFDARSITIAATGGEPLVRTDLFEVMGYAHDLGFNWGMVTNGMLVDPDVIEECRQAGMSTVTVSLDGLKESHEFMRKGVSFEKTINALKLFKESGYFGIVEAATCVSQYNIGELPALYELLSDLKIDEWRLLTIIAIGRAREDPMFRLRPAQLRSLLSFIEERRKKKGGLKTSFEEEGFLGVRYEGKVRSRLYYCPAGINIASILSNGDIGACPNLPEQFVQGNIRKSRFKDVWENGYRIMRNLEWKKRGPCVHCKWWDFCRGNSMHLWDFNAEMPSVCHLKLLEEGEKP